MNTFYIILHVFGAVIGAGGAYLSDIMFLSSVKDRVVSKTELRFLKVGSIFVWFGLVLLVVSGLLIFLSDPSHYANSSKFLIKMFVVLVIFINGLYFHLWHFPLLHRHSDHHYPSSDEFARKKKFLVASGVISITSWTLALVLGSLSTIPVSFSTALVSYIILEVVLVVVVTKFLKLF